MKTLGAGLLLLAISLNTHATAVSLNETYFNFALDRQYGGEYFDRSVFRFDVLGSALTQGSNQAGDGLGTFEASQWGSPLGVGLRTKTGAVATSFGSADAFIDYELTFSITNTSDSLWSDVTFYSNYSTAFDASSATPNAQVDDRNFEFASGRGYLDFIGEGFQFLDPYPISYAAGGCETGGMAVEGRTVYEPIGASGEMCRERSPNVQVSLFGINAGSFAAGESRTFTVRNGSRSIARVPEPGSLFLMGAGLFLVGGLGRKRSAR